MIFPGVGEASTAMNYLRERNLDAANKKFDAADFRSLSRNAAFMRVFMRKTIRIVWEFCLIKFRKFESERR